MSLYRAPETGLFFKSLLEKESGSNKWMQTSQEARLITLRHDLKSIKDVTQIYDNYQQTKN